MNFNIFRLWSLKTRVTLFILAIFLVSIWFLTFYATKLLRRDVEHMVSDQQFSTVSFVAAQINQGLENQITSLKTMAALAARSLQENPSNLQELLEQHGFFQNLFNAGTFIVKNDGFAVASVPKSVYRIGVNYKDRDYILAALTEGRITVSKPVIGKLQKTPLFAVTVPIIDSQGNVLGALIGSTDLSKPNFLDEIGRNSYGRTGGFLLVAPQHRLIITGTDKKRIMNSPPLPGINPLYDRYAQGYEGSGVVVTSGGVEVLSSAKKVPAVGWIIIATVPTLEAFAPIRNTQQRMQLITICLTLVVGGLIWWVLWCELAPISTAVKILSAQSSSDMPIRPLPIQKNNEIGELIASFNLLLEKISIQDQHLRKSEEKFRTVASFIHNWEYWIDGDGNFVYVSPSCESITSYTEEEFYQDPELLTTIIHPDDRESFMKHVDDNTKDAKKEDCQKQDFRILTRNGEERWIAHVCRNVFDLEGKPIGRRVSNRDITERKRAEMELIENAQRLKLATTSGKLAVWDWNVKDNIMFWDDRMFELYGITRDTFSSTVDAWMNGLHPEDKQRAVDESNGALLEEKAYDTTYRVVCPDGTIKHIKANAMVIRDQNGRAIQMVGINSDITEQKKAEEILFETNAILKAAMDQSPTGIVIADAPNGTLRYVNDAGLLIRGGTRETIVNGVGINKYVASWQFLDLDGTPLKSDEVPLARAILYGETCSRKFIIRRTDNDDRIVRGNAAPIKNKDEAIVAGIVIFDDITERMRIEKEHKIISTQLQQAQKMESVGQLAGGVAHDFNNMLSVILGYGNIILETMPPDDPLHECAQEIVNAGIRSASIVRQLLAFARKQTITPQILDLNETIEEMLKMLKRLIGEDIDLNWHPSLVWPVYIDPSQLDQILANLCVNARDAINGVGKITIETETTFIDETYCSQHPGFTPGEFVMLSISDNGIGMNSDTVSRIFEPFFTTKEMGKGTGLGLATVYGIVKQNQGFINVYSEPGQGTTFRIYLPRHTEQITSSEKKKEEVIFHGHGETILVVEDEVSILKLASRILTNLGYVVLIANSPQEAVRLAKENDKTIDLLITDVIMPEMNGRDLADLLLALHPNLKCLFMSGYTSTVIADKGVVEEGTHFIQKPFSARDLAAKVHETLAE